MESDDDEVDSRDIISSFGNDILTRAVRDPDRVRQLLLDGHHQVTKDAVRAAFACSNIETLRVFLDSGAPFETRARPRSTVGVDAAHFVEEGMVFDRNDREDWCPLQHAAFLDTRNENAREQQALFMTALLDRQPDLFAVYSQQFSHRLSSLALDVFPGENKETQKNNDQGSKVEDSEQRELPYGLRSVLHSIFEDGARVDPILNHPGLLRSSLDLEHRDPQGRTVFLSMCRSAIGADARIDAVLRDVEDCRKSGSWVPNPFTTTTIKAVPSLFQTLLARGADILAVDNGDKNALHHLLESVDYETYSHRPTGIRHALRYTLQHCPILINQKDSHGTYPIHAALQRLRRYPIRWAWEEENGGLDTVVEDLLAGDADPLARDGKGNTCLHYCADNGLTEELMGDHTRRLFRSFLDRGVDVTARNNAGQTALRMVLTADGELAQRRAKEYSYLARQPDRPTVQQIEDEVFGWFKMAGADWNEVDADGRTLLHAIARHRMNRRGPMRAAMLIGNGVDLEAKERNDRTALDIAVASGNKKMVDVLVEKQNKFNATA